MAYNKTNWENLPSTNTPVVASSLNKIEDELELLDKSNTYSTTEDIPCGTWIDGKTIYKRTVTVNGLTNVIYLQKIGDVNFHQVIDIKGFFYRKDYPIYQLIPSRSNEAYAFEFKTFSLPNSGEQILIDFVYGSSITSSTFQYMTITVYFTKQS